MLFTPGLNKRKWFKSRKCLSPWFEIIDGGRTQWAAKAYAHIQLLLLQHKFVLTRLICGLLSAARYSNIRPFIASAANARKEPGNLTLNLKPAAANKSPTYERKNDAASSAPRGTHSTINCDEWILCAAKNNVFKRTHMGWARVATQDSAAREREGNQVLWPSPPSSEGTNTLGTHLGHVCWRVQRSGSDQHRDPSNLDWRSRVDSFGHALPHENICLLFQQSRWAGCCMRLEGINPWNETTGGFERVLFFSVATTLSIFKCTRAEINIYLCVISLLRQVCFFTDTYYKWRRPIFLTGRSAINFLESCCMPESTFGVCLIHDLDS